MGIAQTPQSRILPTNYLVEVSDLSKSIIRYDHIPQMENGPFQSSSPALSGRNNKVEGVQQAKK